MINHNIMCTSKILTDLCFTKQEIKKKMILQKLLTVFRSKNVLREHKKVCLSINGVQSVKVEEWTIELHKKVSRSRSL